MTLLEAMAAGKPIVATDVGGNPEVVEDEETGYLVPAGDASCLAQAILKILKDKTLAKRMGAAGRKRAEELFDLSLMANQYFSMYKEIVR